MDMIKNELEFYSKFANPLIFALPEATDRVLAAAWAQKIKDSAAGSEKLRTDYMKLLLFALQRKKLVGIFTDDPADYDTLDEFPPGYNLNTMAKQLIEKEQKERINKIRRQLIGQIGDYPPYTTDCSSDLREYVAAQDIPGFGVHCYYAISKYPVTTWNKAEKGVFPKIAKSAVNTTSPFPLGFLTQKLSDSRVKGHHKEASGKGGKSLTDIAEDEPDKKKRRKKKLGQTPPVKPLGSQHVPEEDRKPPTWSSNLLEVVESPLGDSVSLSATTGAIPKEQFKQTRLQHAREQEFDDEFDEIQKTVDDFQKGVISGGRKKGDVFRTDDLGISDDRLNEYDQLDVIEDYERFLDLNKSEFDEDVNQDSLLVQYLKDKGDTKIAKKGVNRARENILGAIPAQSGIPLTTPRPSVSPKRQPSSEKLYKQVSPVSKVTEDEIMETTLLNPEKDPEMTQMFLEASAIEEEPEDFQPEYSYADRDDSQYRYRGPTHQEISVVKSPPREPIVPPTRGSPAANSIISEVIPSLDMEAFASQQEPSYIEPFQTPPRFPVPQKPEFPLDQEMLWIDYLYPKDKETAELLKRVAHVVSDIEQDFPDPIGLYFPQSPPLMDVGPMSFLEDETFDYLVPSSPTYEDQLVPHIASIPEPCLTQPSPPRPQSVPKPDLQQSHQPKAGPVRGRESPRTTPKISKVAGMAKRPQTDADVQKPLETIPPQPTMISAQAPEIQRTPPRRPLESMYFPPAHLDTSGWPSPDDNLASRLQRHEIPERFRDSRRPGSTRRVVVGRTAGRSMPIKRRYVPPLASSHPIPEVRDERYPLSISRGSPEAGVPFPDDETMMEFARGYVPPAYQSPPGVFEESPPVLVRAGRTEGSSLRGWLQDQQQEGRRAVADARTAFDEYEQSKVKQVPPPARAPRTVAPRIKPRKLDFSEIHSDTDTFLSTLMARHTDLPPLPEELPQRIVTPPRRGIPGWDSPERPEPKTPPFYHMPVTSQMLDSVASPFEGVDMSPKDYEGVEISPQDYSGFEMFPADQEYFSLYTASDDTNEDADFFGTDIDQQMFPPSPPGSPLDQESMPTQWYSPPRSPELSPGMQQMRDRIQQTERKPSRRERVPRQKWTPPTSQQDFYSKNYDITQAAISNALAQAQPPPRRRRPPPPSMQSIPGSPPPEDIFGLPTMAQYSPLSRFIVPDEIRPPRRHFNQSRVVTRRPCCSYHHQQDLLRQQQEEQQQNQQN